VEESLPIIRQAGMVLAQLEIPMDTVECLVTLGQREGVPLMLDPAPAQELPAAILRRLTWFTPNESEAAFYTGNAAGAGSTISPDETARSLLTKGCRSVLLKLGRRGAYLAPAEMPGQLIPAFAVTAVDSTAAGDAFNGSFATGLMLGRSPLDSAIFAAAAAAISVTRAGAQLSMPSMSEVERFLESHAVQDESHLAD
jgi:ribokinase